MRRSEAFFDAILDDPASNELRSLYAGWLEAEGDPLGDFIRTQCALAEAASDDPNALALEQREQDLLAAHEAEWACELPNHVHWWTFRRGFVHEISASAGAFVASAPRLFRMAPIQVVHLDGVRDCIDSLAASPFLKRIRFLDLSDNMLGNRSLRVLAQSPWLTNLQGLNLSSSLLSDAGLAALVASPYLTNLEELYLCDNRIGRSGIRALTESPLSEQLKVLSLRFNRIDAVTAGLLEDGVAARVSF
ncbi:MAG: TIGR02996 domain-containing protein [Gemmataceae bacterium]|nr:TIGR02996 domain-containing protein [Gemmataceae bacterium]